LTVGIWLSVTAWFSIFAATTTAAQDASWLSGESTTIFRTTQSLDKKYLSPVYEYADFAVPNLDRKGNLSLYVGGWGRTDLDYRTTKEYHNGDLQYGYLDYRSATNNLVLDLGRQFITEGVASERIDGLYVRSDFPAGFGVASYVGHPVVTEPNSRGGDLIYGGRITNSNPNFYTVGISILKVNRSNVEYREEEGADIWLHPLSNVDLVGRSTYNSITGGWMEHDYKLSYAPLHKLGLNASYSGINYKHYFYNMTSDVFSLTSTANPTGPINPKEKVQTVGGNASYALTKRLILAPDYRHYHYYDTVGDAHYFGGKATLSAPGGVLAGVAAHRMDGPTDKLRYIEYRVFAAKKVYLFNLTADYVGTSYDSSINGVDLAHTVIGDATYQIIPALKLSADINYAKTPYFSNDVSGLFKLSYAFNIGRGAKETAATGGVK
jgi:hypothetical protein